MFAAFCATLTPMLVMFCCIVIGYLLNKTNALPKNAAGVLSSLENYVLVPALCFNTFMNYCTVESLTARAAHLGYSLLMLGIAILLAYLLAGRFEQDIYCKNIYRYALTFGNFGFMGNAIVPAILGQEFLYDYLLFTLPLNMAAYTWGISILIPKTAEKKNPLKNMFSPVFCGIFAGALIGLLGLKAFVPAFVITTVENLSACMGPVAMILTGFVVGNYPIAPLLKNKKIYAATALRLFILPALFVAVLYVVGASPLTVILGLFAYATPLGLNTVVFPAAYGGDTSTGASMAIISHTLCVLTIPLMFMVVSRLIGY